METQFTAQHRGGSGEPLVLIHGFTDTWRAWDLILPALEQRFDVLALTLPGHAGGPELPPEFTDAALVDMVEAMIVESGFDRPHIAGNSLGGYVTLQLAARGRAATATALAPAGGWAESDESWRETLAFFTTMQELLKQAVPHVDAIMASEEGRRQATLYTTVNYDHLPVELLTHQMLGAANCDAVGPLIAHATDNGWDLDAEAIDCPVRVVWGTEDKLLPWPSAAARYRERWLPEADWIDLEGVGHCPQLDVPAEAAALIGDFAGR